jgi:hypothetical protein
MQAQVPSHRDMTGALLALDIFSVHATPGTLRLVSKQASFSFASPALQIRPALVDRTELFGGGKV